MQLITNHHKSKNQILLEKLFQSKKTTFTLLILFVVVICSSCQNAEKVTAWSFDGINDRIWVGAEFYTIPLEDWRVQNGRVECMGQNANMRMNFLTRSLRDTGDFEIMMNSGILQSQATKGSMGFLIGLQDETDNDYRSLAYYGKGIKAGLNLDGFIFIDSTTAELPKSFDLDSFTMQLSGKPNNESLALSLKIFDANGNNITVNRNVDANITGMLALANNITGVPKNERIANFWFDDLSVSGSRIQETDENSFGPILFNMYTLNRSTLKMSVQMPPLGKDDNKKIKLQIKQGEEYVSIDSVTIKKHSEIGVFNVPEWKGESDTDYRVVYDMKNKNGPATPHYYSGTIRKEPKTDKIKVAGLTCQYWLAYPYRPVSENLAERDPDILFFSGDQIYEANGGYDIEREDPEKAVTNYLGKWNMFGWAFGDLMKDRPTVCIPDDHEVYQGNLWGEGGATIGMEDWEKGGDDLGGFVQPIEMLDVVMQTNTAHLPEPFDATPLKNGVPVYHSDLAYGGIGFAIVGDRLFKSAPENVSWWEGRKDHLKFDLKNPERLNKPNLKPLGERQEEFLEDWAADWKDVQMKCLLSQTMFANIATHHGAEKMLLYADLDSGGWPKSGRDKAVSLIRKAGAFHISGDQHLTMLAQYGINEQKDAGWGFCTPAISVSYERRFLPDTLNRPFTNRPEHNLPNTGAYKDLFGNPFFVEAVGNPIDETYNNNRYQMAQNRASGFGLITFDKKKRTITADAIPFLAGWNGKQQLEHFLGWPKTLDQMENYGSNAKFTLPKLVVQSEKNPVVQIFFDQELVFAYRMKDKTFEPKVRKTGSYTLKVGYPKKNVWQIFDNLTAVKNPSEQTILVDL